MTPTKRLRSTYILRSICVCDKYSSRNCGIVVEWFGAHTKYIFRQWVVVQLKLEELAKVVVNRHLNREDCSGMTWAESAEGWKTCLLYTSPSPRDATLSRMPSSA